MPIDYNAASSGVESGMKVPSRFSGMSDTIKTITQDLRLAKASKLEQANKNREAVLSGFQQLVSAGLRPPKNITIDDLLSGRVGTHTWNEPDELTGGTLEGYNPPKITMGGGKTVYTYEPKGNLSPTLEALKNKKTEEMYTMLEDNKVRRNMIANAIDSSTRIPAGLMGKGIMAYKSQFAPNDPVLQDWQNIKMVLTDAQLLNTAKTKGAISDREMALFASAAANDDLNSVKRMMPVFNKLLNFINSEEKAKTSSFQKLYGEDPYSWGDYQPEYATGGAQPVVAGNRGKTSSGIGFTIGD